MILTTFVKKLLDQALARPVIWSLASALILRLFLLVYLSITGKLSNLGDQADYLRVVTARMQTPSSEWDERTHQLWDLTKSFLIPTKFLFEIFGIHPFLPKILTVLCSSLVAGVVAFLVIKLTNNRLIALSAGLIIALDPSANLWSTLIMRDSFVWIALAGTALILHHSHARENISKFSFSPFLLIFVIVFVRYLRPHTMAVLCIAIILAELCAIKKFSINTWLITAIAIMTPWFMNLGLAGASVANMNMETVEVFRNAHTDGSTSFATTNTTDTTNTDTPSTDEHTGSGSWRYLPRGIRALWLEPLPHQLNGNKKMLAAFAEQVFWMPIFLFALIGFMRIRRREAHYLYVFFVFGGTSVVWAMIDGNYLTAHRHREEFMWAAVVMAAVGFQATISRFKKRKNEIGVSKGFVS